MRVHVDWIDRERGGAAKPFPDPGVTWLDQVHGSAIVVPRYAAEFSGMQADAAVTTAPHTKLLIRTADCAPVLLVGVDRHDVPVAIGAVHAGWRGLVSGVLPAAVGALRAVGSARVRAELFPCIGSECYEFGESELAAVTTLFGEVVRARTTAGTPALDMVAAVRASLKTADVTDVSTESWQCTACNAEHLYSHRARRDSGRMGLLCWLTDE